MTIQFYGRFDGWWSHAQVGRGLVCGLAQNGLRRYNIWNVAPGGTGGYEGFDDFDVQPIVDLQAQADIGFYIGGYPPFCRGWMHGHSRKMGLFIAESSRVPEEWARQLEDFELVCVPSKWTKEAYAKAGVPADKLLVVHHGLHPVFKALCPALPAKGRALRFLHVCGAASFLDRKGTPQLIAAFTKAFKPSVAQLVLRTPLTPELQTLLGRVPNDGFVTVSQSVDSWESMPPRKMYNLIAASDVVVQPSRAEAFGMVPLEARAVGRRVVMTCATGHREHMEPATDVFVTVSTDDEPIAVNGISEGFAPNVSVDGIVSGLRRAQQLVAERQLVVPENYYEQWCWENVTRPLYERLK